MDEESRIQWDQGARGDEGQLAQAFDDFMKWFDAGMPGVDLEDEAERRFPAHFEQLPELCVSGTVGIHIDRTFALEQVPAALAHVGQGRALGKVVVQIS